MNKKEGKNAGAENKGVCSPRLQKISSAQQLKIWCLALPMIKGRKVI